MWFGPICESIIVVIFCWSATLYHNIWFVIFRESHHFQSSLCVLGIFCALVDWCVIYVFIAWHVDDNKLTRNITLKLDIILEFKLNFRLKVSWTYIVEPQTWFMFNGNLTAESQLYIWRLYRQSRNKLDIVD